MVFNRYIDWYGCSDYCLAWGINGGYGYVVTDCDFCCSVGGCAVVEVGDSQCHIICSDVLVVVICNSSQVFAFVNFGGVVAEVPSIGDKPSIWVVACRGVEGYCLIHLCKRWFSVEEGNWWLVFFFSVVEEAVLCHMVYWNVIASYDRVEFRRV